MSPDSRITEWDEISQSSDYLPMPAGLDTTKWVLDQSFPDTHLPPPLLQLHLKLGSSQETVGCLEVKDHNFFKLCN